MPFGAGRRVFRWEAYCNKRDYLFIRGTFSTLLDCILVKRPDPAGAQPQLDCLQHDVLESDAHVDRCHRFRVGSHMPAMTWDAVPTNAWLLQARNQRFLTSSSSTTTNFQFWRFLAEGAILATSSNVSSLVLRNSLARCKLLYFSCP